MSINPSTTIIDATEATMTVRDNQNLINTLDEQLRSAVIGQPQLIFTLIVGVLTGRPVALTGVPGIAKSHAAKALAFSLGHSDSFARIQCMSDKLPTDFTGYNWFNQASGEWEFRPGPLFKRVVLLDELNRASGRALSGVIEALEEGTVTAEDGVTHRLPVQRVVVATWNPAEHAGTEMLPDAVRDRFELCEVIGYPDEESERIIARGGHAVPDDLLPVLSPDVVFGLQKFIQSRVSHMAPATTNYAVELVNWTRERTDLFALGASPRATKSLLRVAACIALLEGSNAATVDHVKQAAIPVLRHRLEPNLESFNPLQESQNNYIERCLNNLVSELDIELARRAAEEEARRRGEML